MGTTWNTPIAVEIPRWVHEQIQVHSITASKLRLAPFLQAPATGNRRSVALVVLAIFLERAMMPSVGFIPMIHRPTLLCRHKEGSISRSTRDRYSMIFASLKIIHALRHSPIPEGRNIPNKYSKRQMSMSNITIIPSKLNIPLVRHALGPYSCQILDE